MASTRILTLSFAVCCMALAGACGDDDGDGGNGFDAGPTDTAQPDGGDAAVDAGPDAPDAPPTGERLTIAFVAHTRAAAPGEPEFWQLLVTDEDCDDWDSLAGGRCEVVEVAGADFTCERACVITPNRDHVLWVDPIDEDLMVGDLDANYVVSNSRILTQNVETWQYGPDTVVYLRAGTVFAQPLAGGTEREIAQINSRDGRNLPGGFHYAPEIGRIIVNTPTSLSAMDLVEISLSDPTDQRLLYHFISDVEQTTGSFYQGQQDVSVSPDGQFVALLTRALDTTNPCTGRSNCDDEYTCSSNSNRCVGEQLLLHIINRSEAHLLNTPGNAHRCSTDDECGQYHDCDLTNPDAANLGECVPGKLVLGPFGRFACEMDFGGGPYLDPGEYNDVVGAPLWREDGRVLIVASNGCAGTDIDVTDLAALDLGLTQMDLIIQNPLQNHGGDACYDPVEEEWTPEGCNVEIERARTSPTGKTVVFVASSVRSATDTEVWLIDAWGRGGKEDLTRDILTEILDVQVFGP